MPTKSAKPIGEAEAEPMTPAEQLERFHHAVGSEAYSPPKAKPGKLGAEKLTPEEQRRRFEELAREAGCDEGSDARFEAAVKTIAKAKAKSSINPI